MMQREDMVGEVITIDLDEIQRDFLGYLDRVQAGDTLRITRANKPVAELKPMVSNGKQLRPYGLAKGEFEVPDDFDDMLPEDLLTQFEGV
jgi:prevent-host-death family protein